MAGKFGKLSTHDLVPVVLGASRCLPAPALLALRPAIACGLHASSRLRGTVRERMAAALGPEAPTPEVVRDYFRHLADLVVYSVLALRSGYARSGITDRFLFDEACRPGLYEVADRGRGAIFVAPHLVCHELAVARLSQERQVTAIVRHSSNPRHDDLKARWYEAMGLRVAYRPQPGTGHAMREVGAALGALRENNVLAITPDLLQEPRQGVAVTLFGRTAHLPPGAAFLASRTGAPIIPAFFWTEGARYWLTCEAPIYVPERGDAGVIQAAMQEWATRFEAFARRRPDMWLFWLDRRWGRWLEQPAGAMGAAA